MTLSTLPNLGAYVELSLTLLLAVLTRLLFSVFVWGEDSVPENLQMGSVETFRVI